jgi:hypothetical protein
LISYETPEMAKAEYAPPHVLQGAGPLVGDVAPEQGVVLVNNFFEELKRQVPD